MYDFLSEIADFAKVLSDQTRLSILELLRKGESSSKDMENTLDKSQSTISQHLKKLEDANLIHFEQKKEGNTVIKYYSIKDSYIFKIISSMKSFLVNINQEKMRDLSDISRFDTLS